MGRARIPIRRIHDPKARNSTFKKRYAGLTKKVSEFATLCGVDICMICFGPHIELDYKTWPSERSEVDRIIRRYMDLPESERKQRMVDLSNFPKDKKEKRHLLGQEKTPATRFPTWDLRLNHWSGTELRKLLSTLDSKLAVVKERIKLLERKRSLDGEDGGIMKPWNLNYVLSIYSKNDAVDDVKVPPLPPSSFDFPNLLPTDLHHAPVSLDFGSYGNVQPHPSTSNSTFGGFECDFAASNMLKNEFKPKYLQEFQNPQHLLYDPYCLNPYSQTVDMALGMHQEPREPLPQLYLPNYGFFEANGFAANITKDMDAAAANSDISKTVMQENEHALTHSDQSFCRLFAHDHQIGVSAAAARAEANAEAPGGNDWGNLEKETLMKPRFFIDDNF